MFKRIFFLFILLVTAISCNNAPDTYTVVGTVADPELNGYMVYIQSVNDNRNIDSTVIENGRFKFTGSVADVEFGWVVAGRQYSVFVLEPGDIVLDMNNPNSPSGTPLNNEFAYFNSLSDSMNTIAGKKYQSLQVEIKDENERENLWERFLEDEWRPATINILLPEFEKNADNLLGVNMITTLSFDMTPDQFDELYAKAGERVRMDERVQGIKKVMDGQRKSAVGMLFSDFTAEAPDGSTASLSDYVGKGKYTLVDFWASWCGPCRAENPNLVKLYDRFKDKNFEIVGVAVWDSPDDSRKAIEDLNMTWPQIINAESVPTELYGFSGIPFIVLFDPDGKIIARELRGSKMIRTIEKLIES